MSQYKPYPAYKDSGVEWLGRVPEHWDLVSLKYLVPSLTVGIVVNPSDYVADEGLPFLYGGDIGEGTISIETARRISPENSRQNAKTMLKAGDLVTVRVGAPGVTAVVPPECEGGNCASVMLIRRGEFQSDWLCYVMNSRVVRYQVEVVQYGAAQEQFNISHAVDFLIPVPPRDEQELIFGHLLSRETARIDALIEKKTCFIELLREKRQALITHAVTKGLDPNVKMKDSGVEWLGEVPEHWDALPLRRVVSAVKTGGTPSEEPPSPDSDGLAWYTPGDFGGSLVLTSSEKRVSALAVSSGEAKTYPAGAVLVVSIGATLGKVGYLVESASANQQINAVIPNSRMSGYFLAYSLSVKTEAMWFLANAATIGIMNQEKTKDIWLAVPPSPEQKAITEYLDQGTGRLDSLIGKTEHSITLLKERRSALITAAVTGQIDLRKAV